MYSPCTGGMNNSPCHTKSHWESDICRLVCFSSVLLLVGASEPCSHMFHCLLGRPVETFWQKKQNALHRFYNWRVTVLPFSLKRHAPVISLSLNTVNHPWWWSLNLWADETVIVNCWHVKPPDSRLCLTKRQAIWECGNLKKTLHFFTTWKMATHTQAEWAKHKDTHRGRSYFS